MGQKIREVMRSNPSRFNAGFLPGTENGRLTGMVNDRDISIRVARKGDDTQTCQVVQEISQ